MADIVRFIMQAKSPTSHRLPKRQELNEASKSIATPPWMGCWSTAGLPPSTSMLPEPIETFEWRATMRSKASFLRKQCKGRDPPSKHRPSELKSNAPTTSPQRPCVSLTFFVIVSYLHIYLFFFVCFVSSFVCFFTS